MAIKLYYKFNKIAQYSLNKLETFCGCTNHISTNTHPYIFSMLLVISIALIVFLIISALKIYTLKQTTKKFTKSALKNKTTQIPKKLLLLIKKVRLNKKVTVIIDKNPTVFCYGYLKPKICISLNLVNELDEAELNAVLLHEKNHLLNYEPLKSLVVKIISAMFSFIPVVMALSKQYTTISEIIADGQATNNWKNKKPLAGALYKVIKLQENQIENNKLALSFFCATNDRINKLINKNYTPTLKMKRYQLFISLLFFVSLLLPLSLFAEPNNKINVEQIENCKTKQHHIQSSDCEKSIKKQRCLNDYIYGEPCNK